MSYNRSEFKQHFPSIAAHLGPTGIEIFTHALVPTEAAAGDVLISCGARSDTLYLIRQGLLAISIEADGNKLSLGEVGGGSWVGEITMIEPGSATTTVIAKQDSVLLALSNDGFETLRKDHPKVASSLLKALSLDLANRLRSTRQLLIKISEDQYFVESTGNKKEDRLAALGRTLMGLSRREL
ncbi:MAG: cyclic nucleotide-binding domain-containing protein [Gammaproteobacteria bacterium]|nr:cyclic nucleotide-binding domain-containing protein [Gammaproteobacteria bacterium]